MRKKEEILEQRIRNCKMVIIVLLVISLSAISYGAFNQGRRDRCIDECAKKVVTTLEMVTACMDLSNITSEQLTERYFEMFVFNKEWKGG